MEENAYNTLIISLNITEEDLKFIVNLFWQEEHSLQKLLCLKLEIEIEILGICLFFFLNIES